MKRKIFLSLTALVLALTVNVAFAQSNSRAKADVPFAFSIGQNSMEAGQYSITVSDHVMKIRNEATNKTVALLAQPSETAKPQSSGLVFHKYGDRYYLAAVWTGTGQAGASGIELPASKAEQETRAAAQRTRAERPKSSSRCGNQISSGTLAPGAPPLRVIFLHVGWSRKNCDATTG